MMKGGCVLFATAVLLGGCTQFNHLVNGEPRRNDPVDTLAPPAYIDGVTSFDYDAVYNVSGVSLVKIKRPTDTAYWNLNAYEYSYDATAHALHFGKLVALENNGEIVENEPAAPIGTLYRIIEN